VVALLRNIKSMMMMVQMYCLMLADAAIYIWAYIVAYLVAFALALWVDTETALQAAGHC
jgi:hypothetical protein